jgi:DNA-binding IclR family transcriptional regulator
VAELLGVNRSIASRLLAALEARQFVTQDPDTGRFRLGLRNLDLGALYVQSHRLVIAAMPYLEQLGTNESIGGTANLFVLDAGQVLRLAAYPARPLTRLRVPAHCTAAGKVLLASLDDTEVSQVLVERGLPAQTPNTITDPDDLRRCLEEIRQCGYAVDAAESDLGGYCFAAAIRDVSRRTVGAVSVSISEAGGPEPDRARRIIEAVTNAARRISESLGTGLVRDHAVSDMQRESSLDS